MPTAGQNVHVTLPPEVGAGATFTPRFCVTDDTPVAAACIEIVAVPVLAPALAATVTVAVVAASGDRDGCDGDARGRTARGQVYRPREASGSDDRRSSGGGLTLRDRYGRRR